MFGSKRRRTEQAVADSLRESLNGVVSRAALTSGTGRLPQDFWKHPYILGYLTRDSQLRALIVTQDGLSDAQYSLIGHNVLDALAQEFSNEPSGAVPIRCREFIHNNSAEYERGALNASKVMAVASGHHNFDNDDDVKAARAEANEIPNFYGEPLPPDLKASGILEEKLFYGVVDTELGTSSSHAFEHSADAQLNPSNTSEPDEAVPEKAGSPGPEPRLKSQTSAPSGSQAHGSMPVPQARPARKSIGEPTAPGEQEPRNVDTVITVCGALAGLAVGGPIGALVGGVAAWYVCRSRRT